MNPPYERTPCFVKDPAKNQMILAGYIEGHTYFRNVAAHHIVDNMGNAFAIQRTLLDQFNELGIETVRLIDKKRKLQFHRGVFRGEDTKAPTVQVGEVDGQSIQPF